MMCKKIKNNRQFAVFCAEEVGEQLNVLSCFSTWSSSVPRHVVTTHGLHERGKHLIGEISVPVCVTQHRCPSWLWSLTKESAGVPLCASQGSVHPQHVLNAIAIVCDCTLVIWCGRERAAPGCANTWVTASLQCWPCLCLPGKWVLDPSRGSTVAGLTSACCVPGFYYNVITQWPVMLETVHNCFVPCTPVQTGFKRLSGTLHIPSVHPLSLWVTPQCE